MYIVTCCYLQHKQTNKHSLNQCAFYSGYLFIFVPDLAPGSVQKRVQGQGEGKDLHNEREKERKHNFKQYVTSTFNFPLYQSATY